MDRGTAALIGVVAALLVAGGAGGYYVVTQIAPSAPATPGVVRVVAAENFWGSLAEQLGGRHAQVHTIISDPNADPHDHEITTADAIAVADAGVVIENGAGYDDWCQQLVTANDAPGQLVLNVAELVGARTGDNPHFWYGAGFVRTALGAMYTDLVHLDPADRGYFSAQYAALNASLQAELWGLEAEIRANFSGTPVASTESVFAYLAASTGLDLVSPPAFMDAVAQGNDPPASAITTFQDQLTGGQVRLLVYNAQTETPLTGQMEAIAAEHHVAVVAITETMTPAGTTFQLWMEAELIALQSALAS